MSRLSFRQRLTLFSAAGIAVVLLVGSAAIYLVMRSQLRGQVDESLRRQSDAVVVEDGLPPGKRLLRETRQEQDGTEPGGGIFSVQISAPPPEFGDAPSFFQLIDVDGGAVAAGPDRSALPVSQRALAVTRTGTGAY